MGWYSKTKSWAKKVVKKATSTYNKIKKKIKASYSSAKNKAKNTYNKIKKKVKSSYNSIKNKVTNSYNNTTDKIKQEYNVQAQKVKEAVKTVDEREEILEELFDFGKWYKANFDKVGDAIWLPDIGVNARKWGAPRWLWSGLQWITDHLTVQPKNMFTGEPMMDARGKPVKFFMVTQMGVEGKLGKAGTSGLEQLVKAYGGYNTKSLGTVLKVSTSAVKKGLGAKTVSWIINLSNNSLFKGIAGISFIGMMLWNVLTDWVWIIPGIERIFGGEGERAKSLSYNIETNLKQAHNLIHIKPTVSTKKDALGILRVTKPLIEDYYKLLYSRGVVTEVAKKYPEYENVLRDFISNYNDLVSKAGGTSADKLSFSELKEMKIDEYVVLHEFTLSNTKVEDGDTLEYPGHPEAQNKIRIIGLDTHESDTGEGRAEMNYLKSLIEGKTVTIKTHQYSDPDKTYGSYGRLLGGVFYQGRDIVLKMLEKFGEDILTLKKYRDKYRWINWDQYENTAKAGVPTVSVGEIKINTKPTYADIWLDGKNTKLKTAEILKDIATGSHKVTLKLFGFSDYSEDVDVEKDKRLEVFHDFKVVPELPPEEVPELPPELPPEVPEEPPVEEPPVTEEPPEGILGIVLPELLPDPFTPEQEFALREVFKSIDLARPVSQAEFDEIKTYFQTWYPGVMDVLDLVFQDLWYFIEGVAVLSNDEFLNLKLKYRITEEEQNG